MDNRERAARLIHNWTKFEGVKGLKVCHVVDLAEQFRRAREDEAMLFAKVLQEMIFSARQKITEE